MIDNKDEDNDKNLKETKAHKLYDCTFKTADEVNFALKYVEDFSSSERNRRNAVESKASVFVGTFSIAITLVISFACDFIFDIDVESYFFRFLFIIEFMLIIIYLFRSTFFSIKALKKAAYRVFEVPRYLFSESPDLYILKRVFIDQYNCVMSNRDVINKKVDYMVLAQEYFIRAMVVVVLLAISLSVFFCLKMLTI